MKQIVTVISILVFFTSFSQKTLAKFSNGYSSKFQTFISYDEVLPIVNKKNDEFSLLFIGKRKIHGYLFDDNFNKIDSLTIGKRPRKYKETIGSSISLNNDYRIFLMNNNKRKFAVINFSFKDKKPTISELDLKFKFGKEVFIQSINLDNKFYLLTKEPYSSIINIYSFDEYANYKKHIIDLSEYEFLSKKGVREFDYFLPSHSSFDSTTAKLHKFDENSINSLDQTSNYTKMYIQNNHLVFTLDDNNEFTQIIDINLTDYHHSFKKINKIDGFKAKNSNSYLFKNKIFQVASTSKEMYFIIRDFNTGDILKQYSIKNDEPISFKNTDIIQYGGAYANKRVLKNTKQYLRKVANSNIGVTVDEIDEKYYITIGGFKEIKSGGGGMMMDGMPMPMGFPIISLGSATMFFNPIMTAYGSYTKTKSVNIKTILDEKFNHLEGNIQGNAFDKIDKFIDEGDYPEEGQIMYKYKNYYILGHNTRYNPYYKLRKF